MYWLSFLLIPQSFLLGFVLHHLSWKMFKTDLFVIAFRWNSCSFIIIINYYYPNKKYFNPKLVVMPEEVQTPHLRMNAEIEGQCLIMLDFSHVCNTSVELYRSKIVIFPLYILLVTESHFPWQHRDFCETWKEITLESLCQTWLCFNHHFHFLWHFSPDIRLAWQWKTQEITQRP